jgi:hypothetical protein
MGEAELYAGVRNALRALNTVAEEAIRRQLTEPFDLGHSG